MLILHAPAGQVVTVNVNGTNVEVGDIDGANDSLVIIRNPDADSMTVTVIDGTATIDNEDPDVPDVKLYPGQESETCVDADGNVTCFWKAATDRPQSDLEDELCEMVNVPLAELTNTDVLQKKGSFTREQSEITQASPTLFQQLIAAFTQPGGLDCESPPSTILNLPPVPEITLEQSSPATQPAATETPESTGRQANLCYAGRRWGDGRCNNPDPDRYYWYWLCGWHFAQYEDGNQSYGDILDICKQPAPGPPEIQSNDNADAIPAGVPTATVAFPPPPPPPPPVPIIPIFVLPPTPTVAPPH